MTRDEILAIFGRRAEAWRWRDPAALSADHAADCVVVSPMFGTVEGRPAIEASYRQLFAVFQDWEFIQQDLLVDADRAAQTFTVRATHEQEFFGLPGSGRRFELQGVLLFRFADGGIAHERRLYDFTALLVQLGVLRAKPSKV